VTTRIRAGFFCVAALGCLGGCAVPEMLMPDASRPDSGAIAPPDAALDVQCAAGQQLCAGRCASTQSDTMNCGACGVACSAGQSCVAGACRSDCPAPRMQCSGMCLDVQTDNLNCGACGRACPAPANAAAVCAAGACAMGACAAGFADCDRDPSNGCEVDTRASSAHCGACGTACAAGQMCVMGACRLDCPLPGTRCGAGATMACVDTQTSVAHCGACDRGCAAPANAAPTCVAGTCGASCNPGYADCDRSAANGCEADLLAGGQSCGGCGLACAPANAAGACVAGRCGIASCRAGFADCDGNAANGCEANLNTDPVRCGSCAGLCAFPNAGRRASAGACALGACATGFGNCDGAAANGCETHLSASTTSCGMCGRACAAGASCNSGTCVSGPTLNNPFDTAANFPTGWTRVNSGGAIASVLNAGCALRGAQGLMPEGDMVFRTTPVVGAAGTRASVYFRAAAARTYLVFGISGTTGFAFVGAPNTSALIWQQVNNITTSPGYTDLATSAYTFTMGQWYRLEVVFDGTATVRGNLYAANGTTLLVTLTRALPSVPNGGVGLRAFGGMCVDELEGVAR
jgi:hypothetical protein